MRLFVAVWPPAQAVDAVAALDRPDVAGLRWTTPDQWHVTLRFLGEVGEAAPVVGELSARLAGVGAVTAQLGPLLGRFGRRILQVPVSGLASLAHAVGRPTTSTAI